MIRATVGIWLNYATTAIFQVAFAIRYGTGADATVFVLAFGLVLALGGITTASVQAVAVPRLLDDEGRVARRPMRLLIIATGLTAVVFALLAIWPYPLANAVASLTHVSSSALAAALRPGSVFVFLLVVAGELTAVALAIGHRFLPAVAPAIPSTIAVLSLLASRMSASTLLTVFAFGAGVEVLVLAGALKGRVSQGSQGASVGLITVVTALQLALLATIPSLERIMAASHTAEGAAQYNYAIRSLAIVQQLVVGGLILSSLGDWSGLFRVRAIDVLRASFARTVRFSVLLLSLAGAIGLVAAHDLVAAVYQHGSFDRADTVVVAGVLVLALPGFVSEGLGLVLSQGLMAIRRNDVTIGIGFANFALRLSLMIPFSYAWGARGVACAYSGSAFAVLLVQWAASWRLRLLGSLEWQRMVGGLVVAIATLASGVGAVAAGTDLSTPLRITIVVAVFTTMSVIMQRNWPAPAILARDV